MRTGVSYMGHYAPKHIEIDLKEMQALRLDDVFVAAQENDFVHFVGKIRFTPRIAKDHGIRPLAIFWGVLNHFGGGTSSQFLLEHPEGFQVGRNGAMRPQGCYVNPACVARVKEMIDTAAECGFEGYFVDEPAPQKECFCNSCRLKFAQTQGGNLAEAGDDTAKAFRRQCLIDYIRDISAYCKATHPRMETMLCLTANEQTLWREAARIDALDNLGTDIYLCNKPHEVEWMTPRVRDLAAICRDHGKLHHEWLQCFGIRAGRENRILEQGEIHLREQPGALYVWAWNAQLGTTEVCANQELAWQNATTILKKAKGLE